jgi:hypothetical protein
VDLILYGQAGRGSGAVLRVLIFRRLLGYVPCKVVNDGFLADVPFPRAIRYFCHFGPPELLLASFRKILFALI